MSFMNQDSSGKSWFKFLSYPEATKGDIKITYTTDGINYSDSKPSLEQLKGYMVELLKPIVYPDDANNQENDIEVSFQLSPDTDYILSNSNLNKQFIPFSGEYWLQNYSPYPFFTDRNQLQFVYPDYSKGVMVKYVDEEGNEADDGAFQRAGVLPGRIGLLQRHAGHGPAVCAVAEAGRFDAGRQGGLSGTVHGAGRLLHRRGGRGRLSIRRGAGREGQHADRRGRQ